MTINLSGKKSIVGRSPQDIEKYGFDGSGYIGKVLMSKGEKPVLGRKIFMDMTKPHLVLVCGKRGGGKCLAGDTLMTLEDGPVKKISELEFGGNKVLGLDHSSKISKLEKTEFYKRTVKKTLKVKLRSGKEIELTPEHPLLTVEGWKPAEELKPGSRIATPRKQPVFGNGFLRESEVKLLAYLIAEGHTTKNKVWFSNQDSSIINDFKNSVKDFDKRLSVKLSSENNYRVVNKGFKREISNDVRKNGKFSAGVRFNKQNAMKKWLEEIGCYGKKAAEKNIPQEVFRLPKPKLALFLNRFFSCDGTIYFDTNTNSWRASASSASEELARQLQHLLSRFEVISTLRKKNILLNNNKHTAFELELKGRNVKTFLLEIGFFGEKEIKQKRALQDLKNKNHNPNLDTVPKEIWELYRPKNWAFVGRQMGYSHPKALRESTRYSPSRQKLLQIARADGNELIAQLAESDIYWDMVKEVNEICGEKEVYDIVVPGGHNFVANDVIVHNSYTMAVMLEEFARLPFSVKNRISVIVIDTVGIFWSLKFPDRRNPEELADWDLKPSESEVRVLVPKGKLDFYTEKGLPVDGALTLKAAELDSVEWMALFKLTWKDPEGVLITTVVEQVKEKLGSYYGIDELISAVKNDTESTKLTRQALINRLKVAKTWGLIEKQGTRIRDIAKPGAITIIDVSAYRQAIGMEGTRDIIVALIGKKLFEERMLFRKEEEINVLKGKKRESAMPIVWMMIDEAHMFMPNDEENLALQVLLEWVRVGRQPGLSLLLATQRPNKLHPDAISQCDLFISHRMTSKPDIEAVAAIRPSYLHQDFDHMYAQMPKSKGYALIIDDNSEKIWMIKIRPRFSWDAGVTASAFTD